MLATGTDAVVDPLGYSYADDIIIMPLQSGTQWDGLSHAFHIGKMYNGYSAALVTSRGAQRNGIEKLSGRVVTRGLLLDLPRVLGPEVSAPGRAVTANELEAVLKHEGISVEPGDALLVRTGWMSRFLQQRSWQGFDDSNSPGLSYTCAEWLRANDVVAVATDTYRVEVKPTDLQGARSPFHLLAIVYMGMLLGEIFQLEELAEDCAADGVYQFLFVAPPLPFTGAVGSPVNPYAIK